MKLRQRRTVAATARWCAALSALALSAVPAPAAASTVVEWEAPEACPGAAAVFERLSASLGYEPRTLGKLSRVRGDVVPSAQGYRLSLEVYESGRRSSRWLEAASCEDLVDAAVLAITLALALRGAGADATRAASHDEAPADARGHVAAGASADGAASSAAATPPADSPEVPVRGVASLGMVAELGALPEPALGVSVSAGAEWQAWSLGAYGILFGGQRLAVRPAQSVDVELSVAGLRGCRRWLEQPLLLDTCVALEAGRWEAFGTDLQAARRARDLWLAPGAALAAGIELTPALALQVRADAVLPLTRKRYIVNENEGVHASDAVSWRLAAGLVIHTR
jgi:hypothetical protein